MYKGACRNVLCDGSREARKEPEVAFGLMCGRERYLLLATFDPAPRRLIVNVGSCWCDEDDCLLLPVAQTY